MVQNNYSIDSSFEEPILWQFSPKRYCKITKEHIFASIGPLACLLLGFIMALSGVIVWLGLFLFGGTAAVTFLIIYFAIPRRGRPLYAITETKIIICPLMVDIANIEKIKKSRSLFNRRMGRIKFKLKKGFNANYQFVNVDNVDSVYDLLISLLEEHK